MNRQKAFTLIELLVVISIIALLLTILMPALKKAKKQTRTVICLSNLRQWSLIWRMYCDEYNGRIWGGNNTGGGDWPQGVRNYYEDKSTFRCCPEATKPRSEGAWGTSSCWGKWPEPPDTLYWQIAGDYGSYGLNGWVCDLVPGDWHGYSEDRWRTLQAKNASRIPFFGDCWGVTGEPFNGVVDGPTDFEGWAINQMSRFGGINRHYGYNNLMFMDFSIRKVGIKEMWTLKWHRSFDTANIWTTAGGVTPGDWPEWMRRFKDY